MMKTMSLPYLFWRVIAVNIKFRPSLIERLEQAVDEVETPAPPQLEEGQGDEDQH